MVDELCAGECADIEVLRALVGLDTPDQGNILVTCRMDQIIIDHFRGLRSPSLEDLSKKIGGDMHVFACQTGNQLT